jgi:hypothetical protein
MDSIFYGKRDFRIRLTAEVETPMEGAENGI